MSSDIYAKPDFSKKVRYNRKVQEDNVEWEERTVAIYESTDDIRDDHTDLQSHDGGPHTENHPPAVQSRPFRAAAFCLGVLCFLTITGIILLYIRFTLEKDQLQTRYDKLYNNYNEVKGQISDMAVNISQLQSSYETLRKNHSQLQDEVKQLKDKIKEKCCPEGWKRFGFSCYFKSNETKTWSDSRRDCQSRGADLVIINNKEEQKCVIELNKGGDSWIGLRAIERFIKTGREWKRKWEWKWVDSSPLTKMFGAAGFSHQPWDQYAAACCDQQGKWTHSRYDDQKNWICEKEISCIPS
ncbi:CD209 antigen-like protein E [Micropterus salmoides]|uniref:CD209 antigen-like protein E n=1 Tax=Micropterus salmoides TaxID=27706 RepID=UPI0018EA799E|nr:CD209 antigen-like protein E [Micropterus salmoides]